VVRWLLRRGVRRGVLGGSRPWTVVAVVAGSIHLFGRLWGKTPQVVYREELEPGQTIVVSHEREPG
jgi:hypothetical protein